MTTLLPTYMSAEHALRAAEMLKSETDQREQPNSQLYDSAALTKSAIT